MSIHEEGRPHGSSVEGHEDTRSKHSSKAEDVARSPANLDNEVHDDFPKFAEMPFRKVAAILLSLGLATFIFAIDETIVATSVSSIGSALNAKGSLAWISTGYLMTQTSLQPIVGRVADIVGAKRLLIIEVWIFIAGCLISGLSNSLELLVAGRLISGVGAAGMLSLALIIITYLTNETERGAYFNLVNFVFIVADSIGPLVGAALAKSGNWRWMFLLAAPFGPVITLFLLRNVHLPRSPVNHGLKETLKQTDVFGMIFLVAGLSFLVVFLNLGGQTIPWTHPTLIGLYVATGVSFGLFVLAEYYAELPVAPLTLFSSWEWRNVPIMFISRTLLFFHVFAMAFYLPIYLQMIGSSSTLAAAMVIPFLIMAALSSITMSHVIAKWNHVRITYHAPLIFLPVAMGLLSTLNEHSSLAQVAGYSLLAGFGFGGNTQTTMVIAQNRLPLDLLPTVTSLISTAPALGGVLGVGIVGTVINNIFKAKLLASAANGLDKVFNELNLNDAVTLLESFPETAAPEAHGLIVQAYMTAFQKGMYVLVGAAVFQIIMSIPLRKVVLDSGKKVVEEETEKRPSSAGNV